MSTRYAVTYMFDTSSGIRYGVGPFASRDTASRVFDQLMATSCVGHVEIVEMVNRRDAAFYFGWSDDDTI